MVKSRRIISIILIVLTVSMLCFCLSACNRKDYSDTVEFIWYTGSSWETGKITYTSTVRDRREIIRLKFKVEYSSSKLHDEKVGYQSDGHRTAFSKDADIGAVSWDFIWQLGNSLFYLRDGGGTYTYENSSAESAYVWIGWVEDKTFYPRWRKFLGEVTFCSYNNYTENAIYEYFMCSDTESLSWTTSPCEFEAIKKGDIFDGYYDQEIGGLKYVDSDYNWLIEPTNGLTLYARYTQNATAIKAKAADAENYSTIGDIIFGDALPTLSHPPEIDIEGWYIVGTDVKIAGADNVYRPGFGTFAWDIYGAYLTGTENEWELLLEYRIKDETEEGL